MITYFLFALCCVKIPDLFSPSDREAALSHLPLWRLVSRQPLPLYPLKSIKSAIQVYYSLLKPAVDGATQYLAQLRSATTRYTWLQKLTMDVLFCAATNAVLLYRVRSQNTHHWQGIKHFREQCSRRRAYGDCILDLGAELVAVASTSLAAPSGGTSEGGTSSSTAATPSPPAGGTSATKLWGRNRIKFYNSEVGRALRLDRIATHTVVTGGRQRCCVLCDRRVTSYCVACSKDDTQVTLCKKRPSVDVESCAEVFHRINHLRKRQL